MLESLGHQDCARVEFRAGQSVGAVEALCPDPEGVGVDGDGV